MKRFLYKLKYDRRGVALEMAIALLVITFALSTLVLSTSLLQYSNKIAAEEHLAHATALEQIGETFCAATAAGITAEEWTNAYPDFNITVEGLTLTVSKKDSDAVLLTVVLEKQDNNYTVIQWSYN